ETVIPVVSDIARCFRKFRRPVVHVVRLYRQDGSNADLCRRQYIASGRSVVAPHSAGAAIVRPLLPGGVAQPDHLKLLAGEIVPMGDGDYAVYKPRWGAFYDTPLENFLKQKDIRSLIVVGCNFPNCPRTTIYEASERDFSIGAIPQALSGIYPKGQEELLNIGINLLDLNELHAQFTAQFRLCEYRDEWKPHFENLNKAWLNKYFTVEPVDEYVLSNPEEAILNDGGKILFVAYGDEIVGTVALKKRGDDTFELTKMAVDERFQGMGAGTLLCQNAVASARALGAKRLVLFTQKRLETAITIYRKVGFRDIPVEPGIYDRADVMMELQL